MSEREVGRCVMGRRFFLLPEMDVELGERGGGDLGGEERKERLWYPRDC